MHLQYVLADASITCNAIGDPLSYDGWTYEWEAGRHLKRMTRSGGGSYGAISVGGNAMTLTHTQSTADASHMFSVNSAGNLMLSSTDGNPYTLSGGMLTCEGCGIPGTTVEYRYDASELRVEKIVDGVSTHYTLHGKLLTHLTKGMDKMHFFYDAQSKPAMVDFNGTLYTYVHNLQGDIVAIVDSTGEKVVEYRYDAWGKPTGIENRIHETDSTLTNEYAMLANLNPFRYRGYVWDPETGLYYLRSRYYDPVWGRFLNADGFGGKIGSLSGHNLFAYCAANPVGMVDLDGTIPSNLLFGIAFMVVCGSMLYFIGKRKKAKSADHASARNNKSDNSSGSQTFMENSPMFPGQTLRAYNGTLAPDDVISVVKDFLGFYGYEMLYPVSVQEGNIYRCPAQATKTGQIKWMKIEVQMISHRTFWGWTNDLLSAFTGAFGGYNGTILGVDIGAATTAIDGATNIAGLAPYTPPSYYDSLTVTNWWIDSEQIWGSWSLFVYD